MNAQAEVIVSRALRGLIVASFLVGCAATGEKPQSNAESAEAAKKAAANTVRPKPKSEEDEDVQVLAGIGDELRHIEQQDLAPAVVPSSEEDIENAATGGLPLPKDPNTFLITADVKNSTHPNYGVGDKRGLVLNGVQGDTVVVKRGTQYVFQVRTGVQHDIYLTTSKEGWGASAFEQGVKGQFTYRGDIEFTPSEQTPEILYYQCRNHRSMGGPIKVVATDEQVAAAKAEAQRDRANRSAQPIVAETLKIDSGKAKQKLAYAEMLIKLKAATLSPADAERARADLAAARQAFEAGRAEQAYSLADQVGAMMSGHLNSGAVNEQEQTAQKQEYEEKAAGVKSIAEAHQRTFEGAAKAGITPVDYDRAKVKDWMSKAAAFAEQKQYDKAERELARAEREVSQALNGMLSSRTVVYELKFDSPKDEYNYEVSRYQSYLELLPIAVEMRKPNETQLETMKQHQSTAEFFALKAVESAQSGRYDEAIVIVRDATVEIRNGLMALGVSM